MRKGLLGLLHTDDMTAVKELAAQLRASGLDLEGGRAAYPELLARILVSASASDGGKGVVVVLEEAQAFATHHNQSLLYSLLEATQQPRQPLLLLAVASVPEFAEALEKRVRSRLASARVILGKPDWTEADWADWASQLLAAEDGRWNKALQVCPSPPQRGIDAGALMCAGFAARGRRSRVAGPAVQHLPLPRLPQDLPCPRCRMSRCPSETRLLQRLVLDSGAEEEAPLTRADFYEAHARLCPDLQAELLQVWAPSI